MCEEGHVLGFVGCVLPAVLPCHARRSAQVHTVRVHVGVGVLSVLAVVAFLMPRQVAHTHFTIVKVPHGVGSCKL